MFVIEIDGQDASWHSLESDAELQKQRFLDAGFTSVTIVEKETFNPPSIR